MISLPLQKLEKHLSVRLWSLDNTTSSYKRNKPTSLSLNFPMFYSTRTARVLWMVHVFLLFSYVERGSPAGLAGTSRNVRTAIRVMIKVGDDRR